MIDVERRPRGIVWLTIARPAARNAMTFAMWERLRELALELNADDAVRVVVITGAGTDAFISGTDIGEFRGFGADEGLAYETRMEAVMAALEAIRVPTIAAIAGACTGGGVVVAGVCDLRVGESRARIGIPIARTLGNCIALPNIARLAALIGVDAARRMILTGRLLGAAEAERAGFLSEVVETAQTLPLRAQALAEELTALAPITLEATKEACRRLRAHAALPPDADLVRACYGSADFAEGVDAFLSKRRPAWTGR